MKRRILSILCVLCLVAAMLPPVTASAAAPTTLTVGGTNVLNGGCWKTNENGTLTTEGASESDYNVKYDSATGTLTLKDATINGTDTIYHVGAGIFASGDLTIVLEGSSTVKGVQDPNGETQSIRVEGNLTIQGGGSLTAQGAETSSGSSYGIFVIGSFTQQGGSVTAIGGNVNGNYTSRGLYVSDGTVTAQDGTLTATGGDTSGSSYGISMLSSSSVTVNDAIVTATGGTGNYSYGLYVNSSSPSPSVTLSGSGSLTARSGSATSEAGGIYFDNIWGSTRSVTVGNGSTLLTNSVIFRDSSFNENPLAPTGDGSWLIYGQSDQPSAVGGNYTLEENITIESGNTLTIPAGSTLTVPQGKTLTVDGTLNIANQSSLAGEGTLAGSGAFSLTNPDPVISGNTALTYDGTDHFKDYTLTAPTGTVTVMGKAFNISSSASTDGWKLVEQEIKNAGTYTLTAKNGTSTIVKEVTVNPATISITSATVQDKTYDGSAKTVTASITNAVSGDDVGLDYGTSTTTATAANEYTATVSGLSGNDANNYTLTGASGTEQAWSITKANPDVNVPTGLTATYGDTLSNVNLPTGWAWDAPNTPVGNVGGNAFAATYTPTDTGNYNTLHQNLTVTVSAKGITNAVITLGDALTYTGQEQTQQIASVTVDGMAVTTYEISGNTGTDADTYTLTVTGTGNFTGTATKGWTIAKANYNGATDVTGTVLANWPGEVTLPAIPDGASYGAASTTDDLTGLSIEGSVLSYTGGESIAEGQKYEITVPVDGGQNYEDYNITVTLTGSDKQTLTITGVTAQDGTYNGQTQTGYTGTPSAEGYDGGFTVTYNTTEGKAPTNAGNYAVTIAIPDSDPQYVGSIVLEFAIAKKPLTVSAPSASVYVGDNAPLLALTYTGLVDGESVTPSEAPAFTITKSDDTEITLADAVKTAGTYTITWSNANDTTFTGADNYDITLKNTGTLTVTTRPSSSGGTTTPSGPSTGGSDGWTEIEDEVDETPSGSTVTVDMNGTTEVPAEVFEAVAGKDVTLELDMGGGVKWEINGQDIPTDLDITDLDLGVSLNTSDIPMDVINMVTGEKSTVQLSLAHDGEFGFTMTLTAPVGTENKGLWANLYHYNTTKKQMLFETAAQVDSSGNVALKFTHASEYAIVLDESSHELPFTDTAKGAWYQGAVEYVYRNGIMTGTSATTFEPNAPLSRAMVAQILYNLEGQPTVEGESTFADASGHWAVNAIAWAQQTGVVNGYEDNTFRPNRAVSREELAQMLYNYAKVKGYDLTASGDLTAFPDGSKVSSWAEAAMAWANGNELINGHDDGTLQPGGDSTRAQAASILMSFDLNLAN